MKEILKNIAKSKIVRLFISFLSKALERMHPRFVVSVIIIFMILQYTIVDILFNNIKKESSSDAVVGRFENFLKESKETVSVVSKIIKNFGLDGIRPSKAATGNDTSKDTSIVLKREEFQVSGNSRKIPLCGSEINAKIIGKDSKGDIFFSDDVDFAFSEGELPFGLDMAMHKITSGFRYDVIVIDSANFFTDKPKNEKIESLKPTKYSKFISYEVMFNSIDKAFEVGFFEPRVFSIVKGTGSDIVCGSSVGVDLEISDINGKRLGKIEQIVSVGEGDLPFGLEYILMRLRDGDKVSVFMNDEWLAIDKKYPPKIKIPHAKHLFFDITVKSVKQPPRMFKAERIEGDHSVQIQKIEEKKDGQTAAESQILKDVLRSYGY